MNTVTEMPNLATLFKDGYGNEIVRALLDALEAYGGKIGNDGIITGVDGENVYFLVALVRAILQDRYGMVL